MGPEQDSNGKFVNVYENLFNLITNLVDMMKTEGKILKEKTQDGLQQSRSPFKLLTVSGSIFASNFGKRAENSGELKLIASAFPCQSPPLSKAPRVPRGS